jgi:anti-anti-sigma factor
LSGFEANVRERPDDTPVAYVELRGQLDGAAGAAMAPIYADATRSGDVTAIVLDFHRVDYINSTGIALVVGLLGEARGDAVEVRVYGLSDHYRHIFDITRLADFVTFFDDEPTAVAAPRTA